MEATIEWVCEEQEERVKALFEALDLRNEALAPVAAAWRDGDLVVNRVESDRPRRVEALWHFHPDVDVELGDMVAVTRRHTC